MTIKLRTTIASTFLVVSFCIWLIESDVAGYVLRYRAILFGRYTEGHFASLVVITLMCWWISWVLWPRGPLRERLITGCVIVFSTGITVGVIVYVSHFFAAPRYIERTITVTDPSGIRFQGVMRHRPPNTVDVFDWTDKPKHPRSYPNPPDGYGEVSIRLTSDKNGFRNWDLKEHYDTVVVGDSFAAGSFVTDTDMWSVKLSGLLKSSIYNLAVDGTGPSTYYANFTRYVDKTTPATAIFMIYEGNDFKNNVAVLPTSAQIDLNLFNVFRPAVASNREDNVRRPNYLDQVATHLSRAFVASPVTSGLERLSSEVFEKIGSDRRIPDWEERFGWMPLEVKSEKATHFYSFEPRRIRYLHQNQSALSTSNVWTATKLVLNEISELAREEGIFLLFVYVPSKPHVTMPLAREKIPSDQLLKFVKYAGIESADAEQFSHELFANMDAQEDTFMAHCEMVKSHCLSLTEPLRTATAAGIQTYYTYDQHWTPEGNDIAAKEIHAWFESRREP